MNDLQGVIIFVLIICKRSVLASLQRRVGKLLTKGQTKSELLQTQTGKDTPPSQE